MSERVSFRGWWIVAVGFSTQAVAIGFSVATFSLFVPRVVEEFESSRQIVTLGQSLMFLVTTLAGPMVGRVLDRGSMRAVMTAGALINAGCFACLALVTELWQLGLIFGVGIGLGTAMAGPLASATLVAKWFRTRLGRAQGVTNMGASAGGLLFAPIAGILIERYGWRATMLWFAAGTLLVVPAIWAVVRNRPEDLGQNPDGASGTGPDPSAHIDGRAAWNAPRLLREPRFWFLALPVGMMLGIIFGWMANFTAFCADLEVGTEQAGVVMGVASGLGVAGTLLFGALADRFDRRRLLWTILGTQVAVFVYLSTQPSYGELVVVIALLGVVGGGMMPVYTSLVGRIFGPASFGQVMGLAGLVMLPFAFLAPPLAGRLRDTSGSYEPALWLFAGGLIVASGVLMLLRVSSPQSVEPYASSSRSGSINT